MASKLRKLDPTSRARAPRASVDMAPIKRWIKVDFAGMTPSRLKQIITQLDNGYPEDWALFCHHMKRLDGHLKSLSDTRIMGVAASDYTVEPNAVEGEHPHAESAAEFCTGSLARTPNTTDVFAHLLWAEDVGWSAAEHVWSRIAGEYHSTPHLIHVSDFCFADDWRPLIRGWNEAPEEETGVALEADRGVYYWVDVEASNPNAFVVHVPGEGDKPTMNGDFLSVAWPWLFKRNAEVFRQVGLERHANPMMLGMYPRNSDNGAEDQLFDALQRMSGDHVGVIEAHPDVPEPLKIIEPSQKAGEAHTQAIDHLDRQMTKAMLGSTLAVEIGESGGNRAAAESQFQTTILPRLTTFADRLARTIEKQWFEPLLRLNAHLFGGTPPPTPRLVFRLVQEDPPVITQLQVDAMAVDVDEVRASAGLEAWGPEKGGDRVVKPVAKTAPDQPAFARLSMDEGSPEEVDPFPMKRPSGAATQMTLPLTRRRPSKTSPTCSLSATRIGGVPFD